MSERKKIKTTLKTALLVTSLVLPVACTPFDALIGVPSSEGGRITINNDENSLKSKLQRKKEAVKIVSKDKNGDFTTKQFTGSNGNLNLTLVANIAPPVISGTTVQATNVVVKDDLAYVSYNTAGDVYRGAVHIIDVSDPYNTVLKSEVFLSDTDVNTLTVDDSNRIYLAGATSQYAKPASLEVFSLKNNGTQFDSSLKKLDLPSFAATDIEFFSDKVYVSVGASLGGVARINSSLSQDRFYPLTDARWLETGYNGWLTVLKGKGSSSSAKLLSINSRGRLKKSINIAGLTQEGHKSAFDIQDSIAYVGSSDGGFQAIDMNNSQQLKQIIPTKGITNAASANGDFVFAANGEDGISVIEKDGSSYTELGSLLLNQTSADGRPTSSNMVKHVGDYVFIADGVGGLNIVTTASDSADPQTSIDLWPWGAKAALSFTDDEGVPEPYNILIPELEARGWKSTWFVPTDDPQWYGAWPAILNAYQKGHEIAAHTHLHPNMTTKSEAENHTEMQTAIAELKANIDPSMKFYSFAYPYEVYNDAVWNVVNQYHRYARSGDGGAAVPPNPVPINDARNPDWKGLTAKANTQDIPISSWNSWIDATVESGGWFIEEWHGASHNGVSGGWSPRTLDEFKAHFDHIETFGNDLWIDTMGRVGNYIEERESASVTINSHNTTTINMTVTDNFDFTVPLTILVDLPSGWSSASATQAGQPVEVKAVGSGKIRVAVIPDASKTVVITKQ